MEEMRNEFRVLVGKPEEKTVVERNLIIKRTVLHGVGYFFSVIYITSQII
jgi:hypothetical protein